MAEPKEPKEPTGSTGGEKKYSYNPKGFLEPTPLGERPWENLTPEQQAENREKLMTEWHWVEIIDPEKPESITREEMTQIMRRDDNPDNKNKYCINNSIMSIVDENQRQFVGSADYDREVDALMAGYEKGSFFVPYSNGEKPTDRLKEEQPDLVTDFEQMEKDIQEMHRELRGDKAREEARAKDRAKKA